MELHLGRGSEFNTVGPKDRFSLICYLLDRHLTIYTSAVPYCLEPITKIQLILPREQIMAGF